MKTSGINFCYKNWSVCPFELADFQVNTFHNTLTVQIAKIHWMSFFFSKVCDTFWRPSWCPVAWKLRNSKCFTIKTKVGIELKNSKGDVHVFRMFNNQKKLNTQGLCDFKLFLEYSWRHVNTRNIILLHSNVLVVSCQHFFNFVSGWDEGVAKVLTLINK